MCLQTPYAERSPSKSNTEILALHVETNPTATEYKKANKAIDLVLYIINCY